jgi:hypothetical protein
MAYPNQLNAPKFIKATTAVGLSRLMLRNNIKHGKRFNYFSIQKDGKDWVAWYVYDYIESEAVEELAKKET